MFKYQGWSIMGEWIVRTTKDPILEAEIPVFDGHGYSIQGDVSYRLSTGIEASHSIQSRLQITINF